MNHNIDVSVRGKVGGIGVQTVKKKAILALDTISDVECDLAVVLCDDKFIHKLNRDFRHKDRPTDVLSFPYGDEDMDIPVTVKMLGDIIISIERAKRQAVQHNHSLRKEVAVLLVHGILHLVGYTHENDSDEDKMNAKAAEILAIIEP